MKSLRGYFTKSLIALIAALTLVACSKDEGAGGPGCPAGVGVINGACYDPSNPGNGGIGGLPYYGYQANGTTSNMSQFRDFGNRYTYVQWYYYGYGNNTAQVRILNANNSSAYIEITSPEIYNGQIIDVGYKFKYDGDNLNTYYQIYFYNPQAYKIAELHVTGDMATATHLPYELIYYRNANDLTGDIIVSGTLRKGIDF